MTELFANITLGAVVFSGLMMIFGVIIVANMNDPRNAMHPGGRKGRILDDLLAGSVFIPWMVIVGLGWAVPALREYDWWFAFSFGVWMLGFGAFFSPPIRRARARVDALQKQAFS